ncbi:hypothetical protein TWF281_004627 [Arthrobotrys megalospora]
MLIRSLGYIRKTSVYYRRMLNPPASYVDKIPFGRQREQTQINYFKPFIRMVVYLCNLSRQSGSVIAKSEISINAFRENFDKMFRPSSPVELQESILRFIIKALLTRMPAGANSRFLHPVMNFLAVDSYEKKTKTWKSAKRSTSTFAAMSFCARLCVLSESWTIARARSGQIRNLVGEHQDVEARELEEEIEEEMVDHAAVEYVDEIEFDDEFKRLLVVTKRDENYPMGEWLSQHAYAKVLADNSLYSGQLLWNEDGTAVICYENTFCLRKYRRFIGSIYSTMAAIMQDMMFGTIPNIPLHQIADDPSEIKRGYYFVNNPKNAKFHQKLRLL